MPIVLGQLIDWFDPMIGSNVDPYLLAILYGGLSIGSGWIIQPLMHEAMTLGHKLRF